MYKKFWTILLITQHIFMVAAPNDEEQAKMSTATKVIIGAVVVGATIGGVAFFADPASIQTAATTVASATRTIGTASKNIIVHVAHASKSVATSCITKLNACGVSVKHSLLGISVGAGGAIVNKKNEQNEEVFNMHQDAQYDLERLKFAMQCLGAVPKGILDAARQDAQDRMLEQQKLKELEQEKAKRSSLAQRLRKALQEKKQKEDEEKNIFEWNLHNF